MVSGVLVALVLASAGAPSAPSPPSPPSPPLAAPSAVREPDVHPTAGWLGSQLVPSPGLGVGQDGAHLVLGWQLTPVLYSFNLDPRLSPWRVFVVEPLVRQSGSVEVFVAPEYRGLDTDRFAYRVGIRSTFGLLERGDVLSVSIGTAWRQAPDAGGPSHELGLYTLFGFFGLVGEVAPADARRRWTVLLRVRVF